MTDPIFIALLRRAKLPIPTPEHAFAKHLGRRFRFDYAFIPQRLAVEVEGGVWTRGRHTRGSGFLKDMEKYNLAAELGWRLIRVTPQQLPTLATVELIRRALTPTALEEAA